jgi:chromosome segregation ATPase
VRSDSWAGNPSSTNPCPRQSACAGCESAYAAKHPKPEPKVNDIEGIEVTALQKQLGQANAEIQKLKQQLEQANAEIQKLEQQLKQANVEISELKRKLASAQEQARPRSASAQNAEVQDENRKLRAENEQLHEEKRRALALADQHSIENVELRDEIKRLGDHVAEGLSATAKQKLEAAIRAKIKEIESGYNAKRMAEIEAHIAKRFPDMQKRLNSAANAERLYRRLMEETKKVFTVDQFKAILSCLHPDSRKSVSEGR